MDIKNDEMDSMLREAAYDEFLEKGYRDASMRNICARAGLTTGAMYTRYKNKDELFRSLFENVSSDLNKLFENVGPAYYRAASEGGAQLIEVVQMETSAIVTLIYRRLKLFRLLLLNSEGSSMESFYDDMVDKKVGEMALFFKKACKGEFDETAIKLLLKSQFEAYRIMIKDGMNKKDALQTLKSMNVYYSAGWKALLNVKEEG